MGEPGESVEAFRPQGRRGPGETRLWQRRRLPLRRPTRRRRDRQAARPVPAEPSGALSPRARRFAAEHDFHPGRRSPVPARPAGSSKRTCASNTTNRLASRRLGEQAHRGGHGDRRRGFGDGWHGAFRRPGPAGSGGGPHVQHPRHYCAAHARVALDHRAVYAPYIGQRRRPAPDACQDQGVYRACRISTSTTW
jgi:hypothetical protein